MQGYFRLAIVVPARMLGLTANAAFLEIEADSF